MPASLFRCRKAATRARFWQAAVDGTGTAAGLALIVAGACPEQAGRAGAVAGTGAELGGAER